VSEFPQLYLIRHGETAWSITGQHTSHTDLALTGRGEDEVRRLAPTLSRVAFSRVLTSPLLRARRTCELALPAGHSAVETALKEWDYGDYEGRRTLDIRRERADWTVWRDGCPNGESAAAVTSRADALIAKLRTLTGNIALFSHGQFGTALAMRWIGLQVIHGEHFPLLPASFSILGRKPGDSDIGTLSLWNFTPADS